MMVLDRVNDSLGDKHFFDLPGILNEGDVLVFNESKVIPARVKFFIGEKGVEIFLLKRIDEGLWEAMVRPGKVFKEKSEVDLDEKLMAVVEGITESGTRVLRFSFKDLVESETEGGIGLDKYLESLGEAPFPPYIKNSRASFEDYQTVYANKKGSVAAPTAGLHFSEELIGELKNMGVGLEFVTLHVGMGTFAPVKVDDVKLHKMHSEFYEIGAEVVDRLNRAKLEGRRIIAVGTTSVRVLESCCSDGELVAGSGDTDIFIYPGYEWRFVDGLITNFHLPKSTLLMLVSSFAGSEFVKRAYEKAIDDEYRFYSFGDGMFIF